MQWNRKDLLTLYDLSGEEIEYLLDTAAEFKKVSERSVKKVPALRGKTVVNFFVEPSTRTRVSFELAEQRLSADIVNMQAQASSLLKGETLLDTVRNIEALQVDLVVMRHAAPGAQSFIAKHLKCGVINAGDGAHAHPTEHVPRICTFFHGIPIRFRNTFPYFPKFDQADHPACQDTPRAKSDQVQTAHRPLLLSRFPNIPVDL